MKALLLSCTVLGISLWSCSQDLPEKDVPSVVLNAFQTRFPNTTDRDWEKRKDHYEVEFHMGPTDLDPKARFDASGNLLQFKQDIPAGELPGAVKAVLQAQYSQLKVDEAERVEKGGTAYYQVELEGKLKKMQLLFTSNGTVDNSIGYWD